MRTPHHVTITARTPVTPRMVRLTLAGPSLVGVVSRPAQDIKVYLHDPGGKRVKRRYTIRHARPDSGEIDIDVLIHHGTGPGSRWAADAPIGSAAEISGPRGKLELRAADWHLFVGDEAALPAVAALTEALGPTASAIVLAEVDSEEDQVPLATASVRWLARRGGPPGTPGLLTDALDTLVAPAGQGQAYLLGESRAMRAVREHLGAHGVTPERTFVKGYWNATPR
jgi:NADPH-dependent ferric siderophore reductase